MQALLKNANAEPIPGYRLLEPLGKGGFGEVWKCEAPGGLYKAIKFVPSTANGLHDDSIGAEQELRSLQHVKSIRHPFLLSMERVEVLDGDLVIVMELADRNLHDLLDENRAAGRPGVPRAELLHYLHEAAEVLDLMNLEHGLQHLDIKPRNLFLIGRHVKVADFGLVNSLAELHSKEGGKLQMGGITPLYAAPETFLGKISLFSDQYSLAVTYHEVLTGELPFVAKNYRQMAMLHLQAEPDLHRLPGPDRAAVARALAKDPHQRFPSCTEFIQALENESLALTPSPATRASGPEFGLDAVAPSSRARAGRHTPTRPAVPTARPAPPPPAPSGSFLPGYQFLDCVGRLPSVEIWRALAADGRKRLVKFVRTAAAVGAGGDPVARLRALRHDALAPLEIITGDPTRLALITDPGEATLAARLKECMIAGQTGIPRDELLDYLGRTADALDTLYEQHRLQHLSLTPRQLVLQDGELYIMDHGLVELFLLPAGENAAELNLRYAAPELFDGKITPAADQYSLALIFIELLTGVHPFRGLNQRQLSSPRARGNPDLGLLPSSDRDVILRALHADPARRFPTCGAFAGALAGAPPGGGGHADQPTRVGSATVPEVSRAVVPIPANQVQAALEETINGLVAAAIRDRELREHGQILYWMRPGPSIEHLCFARLVLGTAKLKMDGFREHWQAQQVSADDTTFVYRIPSASSLFQRCMGKRPGLEVEIRLLPPQVATPPWTPIRVKVEPVGCSRHKAVALLEEAGPHVLDSIRNFLQAHSERGQERYPFTAEVQVYPVPEEQQTGEAIRARGKDLALDGMGLALPALPPTLFVYVQFTRPDSGDVLTIPAKVIYSQASAGDRYEVGVGFIPEEELAAGAGTPLPG